MPHSLLGLGIINTKLIFQRRHGSCHIGTASLSPGENGLRDLGFGGLGLRVQKGLRVSSHTCPSFWVFGFLVYDGWRKSCTTKAPRSAVIAIGAMQVCAILHSSTIFVH